MVFEIHFKLSVKVSKYTRFNFCLNPDIIIYSLKNNLKVFRDMINQYYYYIIPKFLIFSPKLLKVYQ